MYTYTLAQNTVIVRFGYTVNSSGIFPLKVNI